MKKQFADNYKKIFFSILVFIIYFAWPYFLTTIFDIFKIDGVLALALRLTLNFILLGIIIYILRKGIIEDFKRFKKDVKKNLLTGLISLICGIVLYGTTSTIIINAFPMIENQNYVTMSHIFSSVPLLLFISTIFYFPVIEEIVFKKTIKDIINNKWLFIILTGFLNAFFQIALSSYSNLLALIYLIPLSLLYMSFSYSYYNTNSIFTSIVFRMLYNLIPNIGNLILTSLIMNL